MMEPLTIVVYHYVRDLARSRYPEIKGLAADRFRGQLGYMQSHYTFLGMEDVLARLAGGPELPPNGVLLTFDDGYADHFDTVFPILDGLGIQGSFFPSACAVAEHVVMDVNKIHFVLASAPDLHQLVREVRQTLADAQAEYGLDDPDTYYDRLAVADEYDPAEVIFIKRLLQRELPELLRASIVDRLFRKYVGVEEAAFAKELYMDVDQLRCMKRHGMYIGSHSYEHCWLDRLSADAQAAEIDRSLEFLETLGVDLDDWVMCYPYGAYDAGLLRIVSRRGCRAGFTGEQRTADIAEDNALLLPRLDTNDLPKAADARPGRWTQHVLSTAPHESEGQ